jgi:alpha-2-macroglobulin-like protein
MVATTRAWLLKQKDGNGGFTRKRRSLHTWIEDKDCSNAYIVWALLETGTAPADLQKEISSLKSVAESSKNAYVVALAANCMELAGDKAEAAKLMGQLAAKQKPDGSVDGITASIVGSEGESLQVEGTSFATLAWLREPKYAGNVEKSIKFLADSCKAGRYGSTQATVLALRSIVTYDKQHAHPKAPGKVRLYVDGQSIGDWAAFSPNTQGAIKLPNMSELLTPGEHKLELRMDGGSPMPYSMAVKYNALTPAGAKDCKVGLTVKLAQDKVTEGNSTEANVTVINKTHAAIPTPVAIVGIPGGLEPRHDQLKELVKKGTIDAYEVLGRDVVLYWRALPADAKVSVPLSLIAAVPGSYTGAASRAYLYYTDEKKQWADGTHVEIVPKS